MIDIFMIKAKSVFQLNLAILLFQIANAQKDNKVVDQKNNLTKIMIKMTQKHILGQNYESHLSIKLLISKLEQRISLKKTL